MLKTALGATNKFGTYVIEYLIDKEYDVFDELAFSFINDGSAIAIKDNIDLEDKSFNESDLEDKAIKHKKKK